MGEIGAGLDAKSTYELEMSGDKHPVYSQVY
jgi:hypothetical protein